MFTKKRIMQAVTVSLAAGMLLSGCSAGSSSSGGREQLTFWGPWSGDQVAQINQMTKKYNASQTKYTVKYTAQSSAMEQKLLTSMAAGDSPDVVLWDSFNTSTYAPKGALQPLNDLIKKDKIDTSTYYPAALDQLKYDGKTYGLPLVSDVRALVYNKTMLKDAGITTLPTTWDELLADAKKMTVYKNGKLEKSGFSLQGVGFFQMFLWQAGGESVSKDGKKATFNSAQGLEVLNFWKQLLDDHIYENGYDTNTDEFSAGNVAMKIDAPWDIPTLDKSGVDYGFAELPAGPTGIKASQTGGFGLVIPKGAKHADGAWDFIKWFAANKDNELAFCKIAQWLPADTEVAKDAYWKSEKWTPFIKSLEYARPRPTITGWSDASSKTLDPALQQFMAGRLTAKQALNQAESQINPLLEKAAANQ
ncbi:ABC transporter substrate-binding protein [Bifidobacterium sp.]|uniref:ABC transporter substrate-binding protein n=1 Tax=Bifidobacterium sp. TaxID=41200 RepID=UPI0039E89671